MDPGDSVAPASELESEQKTADTSTHPDTGRKKIQHPGAFFRIAFSAFMCQ